MPENPEFKALYEASGWTQAETARRLKLDRASVSRYLSEDPEKKMAPSAPVIELFKMILASEKPEALTAAPPATPREPSVLQDAPPRSPMDEVIAEYDATRRSLDALGRALERLNPNSQPKVKRYVAERYVAGKDNKGDK